MAALETCAVGCLKGCAGALAASAFGPAAILIGAAIAVGSAIANDASSSDDSHRDDDDN